MPAQQRVGWQPSRFLTDRAEAERAFALANGSAASTPRPSVAAARQRSGQSVTPLLDPVVVALNPKALPARPRMPAELHQWVRRDEEYAILGANVVVELNSESRARQSTSRAWAIIRRAERGHRLAGQRTSRGDRRRADHIGRSDRTSRSHQPKEWGTAADAGSNSS